MTEKSLEQLRREVRAFAAARDWERFHAPKNLAMALMVETAELAEHFQWLTPEESGRLGAAQLGEVERECADVLIYLVRLADVLGIDLLEAASKKMAVNAVRFPAGEIPDESGG